MEIICRIIEQGSLTTRRRIRCTLQRNLCKQQPILPICGIILTNGVRI